MAKSRVPPKRPAGRLKHWLLKYRVEDVPGPVAKEDRTERHPWWQVVCLTGVDYFSTLGYIPGIAALAAGVLSPVATMFIVLLTLFGALPMYRRVARESPSGQGSIAMLERLLSLWTGKILVLCLLGFVATGWLITITLSAADAATHVAENPLVPTSFRDQEVAITLVLLAVLGGIFLKGFKEAIGIAVLIVGAYLLLNLVVVAAGFYKMAMQPQIIGNWQSSLLSNYNNNPLLMIGASLLVFPRLALGLSGFETGVGLMPLVRGDEGDDPDLGLRRRFSDGGVVEYRTPLPAPLRYGPGVGTGHSSAGAHLHRHICRRHHHLWSRRDRPGWGIRHGGLGDDDLGRLCCGALCAARRIEAVDVRLRAGCHRVLLCPRSE